MTYDEYRRLHVACLDMARQSSTLPDVRARWLAMADVWLKRAIELANGSGGVEEHGAVAPRLH
jgi:hypothetical protein